MCLAVVFKSVFWRSERFGEGGGMASVYWSMKLFTYVEDLDYESSFDPVKKSMIELSGKDECEKLSRYFTDWNFLH